MAHGEAVGASGRETASRGQFKEMDALGSSTSYSSHHPVRVTVVMRLPTTRATPVPACEASPSSLVGAEMPSRRGALATLAIAIACVSSHPLAASGSLPSAAENGLPLLGRFEALKGARAFIGRWDLFATEGPDGTLILLPTGDVELRKRGSNAIIGLSTEPWKYISTKGGDTLVNVQWNVDVDTGDYGVLSYQGQVDSARGAERTLAGTIFDEGRRRVGDFNARLLPEET